MSLLSEILNDIKKCCCPFLFSNEPHPSNNLSQSLIELHNIPPNRTKNNQSPQRSRKRSASSNDIHSDHDSHQNNNYIQNSSEKMVQSDHPPLELKNKILSESQAHKMKFNFQKPVIIKRVSSGKTPNQQRKSISESSSFQTIKSTASRQISRRNFKILRKSSSFYAKHRSIDDDFHSINHSENSSINDYHVHKIVAFKFAQNNDNSKDGIDMMNVWMKKQYEIYPSKTYKPVLSEITKMKLETKDVFDSMVHRLEDFYTFYLEDHQFLQSSEHLSNSMTKRLNSEIQSQSFNYEEANHQMICSISQTANTKSFNYQKTCKFMSLIIIPHCSLSPLAFIQWFNKLEVQSSLHCFNKIECIQNSQRVDSNITLQYPLVRVEQFNEKLIGKQTFVLARQIQVVKFQNQEDKETLIQICFQAIDQEKCYERLVRVTAQSPDTSRAQIYIQSSENIAKRQISESLASMNTKQGNDKSAEFCYFEERWKRFEQKLNKDHIINKKPPKIFTT